MQAWKGELCSFGAVSPRLHGPKIAIALLCPSSQFSNQTFSQTTTDLSSAPLLTRALHLERKEPESNQTLSVRDNTISTKHQPPATKGQMREPRHNGAPLSALALAPGAPTASQLLGRKHALHQSEGRERRLGNPVSPSGLKPAVAHRFGKAFSSDNAADGPRFDPSDIFTPRIEGSPLPPTWASMSQPDRKQWCASKGVRYSTDRYRTAQGTATRPFWIDIAIPAEVAGAWTQ